MSVHSLTDTVSVQVPVHRPVLGPIRGVSEPAGGAPLSGQRRSRTPKGDVEAEKWMRRMAYPPRAHLERLWERRQQQLFLSREERGDDGSLFILLFASIVKRE